MEIESEETVRFETWSAIMPVGAGGYDVVPRVIRTDFVAAVGEPRRPRSASEADRLRDQIMDSVRERRPHQLTPFTGQTAGLVHEVLPAAEIVRRMAAEACDALRAAARHCDSDA